MGAIVGILLAAGRSRRFGADKLLHAAPYGRCIAEVAAGKLLAACDRALAVVGPHSSDQLRDRLRRTGLELVEAADAELGMGATLAAGVKAVPRAAGWVVALADMPAIQSTSVAGVAQALRGGAVLAAPFHCGRRGHPVGFSARWFEPLVSLTGDSGARGLLDTFPDQLTCVEVDDPGVLFDVDTAADLPHLRRFDAPTPLR